MRVLVLEDDEFRVQWLRGALDGTGVTVSWARTVATFRELLAAPNALDDVVLVILDHDLGNYFKSEDENGESGLDGARALTAVLSAKTERLPILMWTANSEVVERQRGVLMAGGALRLRWIAFRSENNWLLREYLATATTEAPSSTM